MARVERYSSFKIKNLPQKHSLIQKMQEEQKKKKKENWTDYSEFILSSCWHYGRNKQKNALLYWTFPRENIAFKIMHFNLIMTWPNALMLSPEIFDRSSLLSWTYKGGICAALLTNKVKPHDVPSLERS